MTLGVLALALVIAPVGSPADTTDGKPTLSVDNCVDVDVASVQTLVELELRDRPNTGGEVPIAVEVRCLDGAQQIRVEPWASLGGDGIRAIELPPVDAAYPAAREARSRELALAIAELIRRLEITRPLPPPPPASPPAVEPPPVEQHRRAWQPGVLAAAEAFTGGQQMAGADLTVATRLGPWLLAEARVGGRLVDAGQSPVAKLTGRAATAAVAVGPAVWSREGKVGVALLLRAQGYAIDYQIEGIASAIDTPPALMGAVTVAAEPRLFVAVSRWITLTAGLGAGTPLHGIVVRTQGVRTDSLTGLALSGGVGAAVTF